LGFLTRLLEPKAAANFGPLEDFWYKQIGASTVAGATITPEKALAISTVFSCVRIISTSLAMLPLVVYRRLDNGGKERATNHPIFDILHSRPNIRQSSFQFREMLMAHALLRGNAFARIVPGQRGFVDQLVPLHPDRMNPSLASDGTIHYDYRQPNGHTEVLLQDEVFHISTLSDDGVSGLSLVALAKESMGLAVVTQDHGSRFFSENQTPAGLLKMPGKLSPEGRERLKDDWKQHRGGHSTAVLEEGLEFQAMGLTNEDSQFLETRIFQVEEIASWFGVPLSLLQHTEKSTSWGTGITQLTLGFVQFTMQPWFARWEQEISQDLILAKDQFFAEFVLEGLLRGDPETRSKFYNIMIRTGVYTRNEVRKLENLNPLPGLDEPLDPTVTRERGTLGAPTNALAQELAADTAARMVRKETGQVEKAAKKYADDPVGWADWIGTFYEGYRSELVEVCKLGELAAGGYCDDARAELLTNGVGTYFEQSRRAEDLASLMMENT